jgi:crotonobetainyl-CoA:carnitine CoA-transferase CaiB-like acyl-CoA transferase
MAYSRSVNAERQPYQTLDGYISIVPYSEKQWRTFLDIGGFPDVFDDPKFATYRARTENTGELYGYIRRAARTKTTDEWLEILAREDIPAMRCNSLEQLLQDPHLESVGFFRSLEHPTGGRYRAMRHPIKFSATPAEIYRHPPRVGEHNAELLTSLRLGKAERNS